MLGGAFFLDLKVLGAAKALPTVAVSRALSPAIAAGLLLLALSGALMAITDARALVSQPLFGWKLGLIALALVNAWAFRRAGWLDRPAPPIARLQAAASVLLWLAVTVLGRLLGYV